MDHRTELVDVIRRVRNRWRLRLALRGAVVVVAGTVLALLLSASGLEAFRFSAPRSSRSASSSSRCSSGCCSTVWSGRCGAASPTRRSRCISRSATRRSKPRSSARSKRRPTAARRAHSPRLVEKLVEQAIEQCRAIDHGRAIERTSVQRHAARSAAIAARRRAAPRVRPGVSAPRPVGAARHLAQRRSGEPVQHRGARPGNAKVPRGARSGGQGEARRLHVERRQRDDAHGAGAAVRARAARRRRRSPARSKACCSTSRSRPSTTSSRTASARRRSR